MPRVTIGTVSALNFIAFVTLAIIKGALVALPSPAAFGRLARLRSPLWALIGPGALLTGTFGVLAIPSLATGFAILAAAATPALAAIAVVGVVHGGRRMLLLVPVALGVVALAGSGVTAELAASLLTALGCLTLGAAIVRLTPGRWLRLGVLAMTAVDVILLAAGIGQPAATLLQDASAGVQPVFHRAQIGPMCLDYPDLVLAAMLGGVVAGRAVQARAAALVAILATANGAFFAFANVLPATVPIVLALILIDWRPRIRVPRIDRFRRSRDRPARLLPVPEAT
jgi:hypothetical protein